MSRPDYLKDRKLPKGLRDKRPELVEQEPKHALIGHHNTLSPYQSDKWAC